jgi:hypothetical protein
MDFDQACKVLDYAPPMESIEDPKARKAAEEWLVFAVDDAVAKRGLAGAQASGGRIKTVFASAFLTPGPKMIKRPVHGPEE